ncbi:hypothetical protein Mapa_012309 [Marchantia paleacea]|nr:hypothetical protein Mapa_012309 [Marchantia paleacea]
MAFRAASISGSFSSSSSTSTGSSLSSIMSSNFICVASLTLALPGARTVGTGGCLLNTSSSCSRVLAS